MQYYEAKIEYLAINEAGNEYVSRTELLIERDHSSVNPFASVEQRAKDWGITNTINNEIRITAIKESNIVEVFPYDDGEWWYRCTVTLKVIDESSGREKLQRLYYAIMADSIQEANTRLTDSLSYLVIPYESIKIVKSKIEDVVPHFSEVDKIVGEGIISEEEAKEKIPVPEVEQS